VKTISDSTVVVVPGVILSPLTRYHLPNNASPYFTFVSDQMDLFDPLLEIYFEYVP
jgi:hypothetical protein